MTDLDEDDSDYDEEDDDDNSEDLSANVELRKPR